MNSWAERALEPLREKEAELDRQLTAVRLAIKALEEGFQAEPITLPRAVVPRERSDHKEKHS